MLQCCHVVDGFDALFAVLQTLHRVSFGASEITCTLTHSVKSNPGRTALIRVLGPCVDAMHRMSCRPAALVTEYAMLLPATPRPCASQLQWGKLGHAYGNGGSDEVNASFGILVENWASCLHEL